MERNESTRRRSRKRGERKSEQLNKREGGNEERERHSEKTLQVYETVRWKIRASSLTTIQPPPRLVSFSFTRCLQRYFYRGHHHFEKISSRPRTRCLCDGIASRGKGGEGRREGKGRKGKGEEGKEKEGKISEKKSERSRYYFLTGQTLMVNSITE